MLLTVSVCFVFFFLLLFIFDLVPQLNTWQSRIKIGRFASSADWEAQVVATSIRWLRHTPTVAVTDQTRLILFDILCGHYKKTAIQHWQQGALVLGLTAHYEQTASTQSKQAITSFLTTLFTDDGQWRKKPTELDSLLLAHAVLCIPWVAIASYRPAFDHCYQLVLQLKGADGTVAYRSHHPDFRYVDTLGFICPFLVRYGQVFEVPEAVSLSLLQLSSYTSNGLLPQSFIPCHTYVVSTGLPAGLYGWGRGLAWYAIGLLDTWRALPDSHPGKADLTASVVSFATMSLAFQNANGSWCWQITNSSSRFDSSTTAVLAWFLSEAAVLPSLEVVALAGSAKALAYLRTVTLRTGAIDFSQGDTKSIGVYSQQFGILPFTQGFCLRTI